MHVHVNVDPESFQRRLSVTRSVRVSLRHDDEHVNYYHQGSLAKLQPVAIESPAKREQTRGHSMTFHQRNRNRLVKRFAEWSPRERSAMAMFALSRRVTPTYALFPVDPRHPFFFFFLLIANFQKEIEVANSRREGWSNRKRPRHGQAWIWRFLCDVHCLIAEGLVRTTGILHSHCCLHSFRAMFTNNVC